MSTNHEVEPGAAAESVLVTTDSCDNFDQMRSSLEEIKFNNTAKEDDASIVSDGDVLEQHFEGGEIQTTNEDDEVENIEWATKKKHIFVLSMAGKPIYSRYGNEDKLAWLFGVMQTLVSFVQSDDDSIKSIKAGDIQFVFLVKKPLILVAASRMKESVSQLLTQLNYVFNQIANMLTLSRLSKIYEQRQNYDLRRLLSGVERLIDHLLDFSEREPAFILGAVQCLPLSPSVRSNISSAIISGCAKIKNLVFAILLADNKLITLVRMKKYSLHPVDLHLIFNLVQASESLKAGESWTPLCLPRFDASGFLYGHVSYLAEDCQACLFLLTVEREMFYELSKAKANIVEKLRRSNCLEVINESLFTPSESCALIGFSEVRHYLYKCKSTAQFYQPNIGPPYNKNYPYLMELYKRCHQRLHSSARPLKLYFERTNNEALFAWDTRGFELYVIFEPLIETNNVVATITRLLSWMKDREDKLFHLNAPTF